MFGKNHQLKFSIRKLQIGVASLAIGIVGFNTSSYVSAEAITKSIRYEYVTTDELTDLEKQLVVKQLPSNVVDHNDSYYMVYRPAQKSTVSKVLPKTNEGGGELSQLTTGIGLLILGISVLKGKKRKVITTLAILTVTGQVLPVSAIQGHTLSTYNSQHTLEIGSTLPDTILDIEGYEFVGYIVTDDVVDSVPVEESSTSNTTSPVVINEEVRFETEVVEIPFDSHRVVDPELEVGTSKVVQQGQKGSVTYTYKVTVKADGNQEREVIETHQVPAVPEVIHIGTKVPVTPNQPVMTTVDETIPRKVIYQADPTLENGQEIVEVEGTDGVLRVTYSDGNKISEEIIQPAVDRIVRYGTQGVTTPIVTTATETIPFQTIYVEDSTLDKNKEVIVQEGVNGVKNVTYVDGIFTNEDIVTPAVDKIIKRGTKELVVEVDKALLSELIIKASNVDKSMFTESSLLNLSLALNNAQAIYDLENSTQIQINEQVQLLQQALTNLIPYEVKFIEIPFETTMIEDPTVEEGSDLVEISPGESGIKKVTVVNGELASEEIIKAPVNRVIQIGTKPRVVKEELGALLELVATKQSSDYSIVSWNNLELVKIEAESIYNDINASQSIVDTTIARLKEAISLLAVEKSILKELLVVAEAKNSTEFSVESWSEFLVVLESANQIYLSSNATQVDIDNSVKSLQSALAQLGVDKSVLETTISTATGKFSSDYSAASWSVLTKALTQAQSVASSSTATQSEIDAAATALKSALDQLDVDKSVLETTISTATGKVSSDYSAASWSVLTKALTQAQGVASSSTATQSEIDAAATALKSALDQLDVDKSVLETTISTATGKVSSDYSAASWSVLTKALTQAQSVASSSTATQSEIDAADVALKSALDQLGVDKSVLETTISTATSKVSSDYSAASWLVLTKALTQAQSVASSSTATQSEIDAADVALKSALANLVQVDKTVTTTIYYPNSLSRVATATQDNLVDLSKLSFSVENPIPTMLAVGTAEFNAIIAQLEAKVAQDPTTAAANVLAAYKTDSDGDGIIDLYDKEKDVWNVSERDLRFMTSLARSSSNVMNNIFNNKRQTAIDDFNSQRLNNGASITELNQHWKFLRYESPGDGLQYHIFGNGVKADGGYENVVIVFRDTQTSETGDILADLAIAAGRKPAQANYLEQAAQYVMAYNPSRVYSGGTSLGGYLAEYFAASTMQSDSSRSSVFVKSSIFNPAAIYVTSVSPTEVTNARAQADVLLKTTFVDDSDQSNPVTVAKTNSYVMQGDWVAAQLGTYDPTTLFATTSTDQHAMQRFYDDSDALKEVFSRGYRMDNHYQTDDTDGDGLTDVQEGHIGTNAKLADTDGDGFSDRLEAQLGSDPLSSASIPYQLDMTGVITNPEVVEVVAKLVYADGSPTQYIAVEMAAVQQGDQLIYTATGTTRTVAETAISAIKAFDKVVTIIV